MLEAGKDTKCVQFLHCQKEETLERNGNGIDISKEDPLISEDSLISDDQKWGLSAEREKQRILDYKQRVIEHQKMLAKEEAERIEKEIEAMFTPEVKANTLKAWSELRS